MPFGLLLDETGPTVSSVMSDVSSFFTTALSMLSSVFDEITSHPALFIMCIAIPVAGVAIGYLSRLIRL